MRLSAFVSALGSHEMGRHKLPIIIIIVIIIIIIIITIIIIIIIKTYHLFLVASFDTLLFDRELWFEKKSLLV